MVSIRKAAGEDASRILACIRAAFEQYRDSYTSAAFADTILTPETIAKRLQEMTVFVATEESGEIIGTIACGIVNAEEGHIREWPLFPLRNGAALRHSC
jgi:predicted N-acetyltransferase YhbS